MATKTIGSRLASIVAACLSVTAACQSFSAELDATRVAKLAAAAIVTIDAKGYQSRPLGQGSGFIIAPGEIATNYHVIAGAQAGQVRFRDGEAAAIEGVLYADAASDVAILVVPSPRKRAPLLMRKDPLEPGAAIAVIGTPLGLEQTISTGVVSAIRIDEAFGRIIQISAPVSPGSSGSPVLDGAGCVAGMVRSSLANGQNLNIAVDAKELGIALSEKHPKLVTLEDFTRQCADLRPLLTKVKGVKLAEAAMALREHVRLHPFAFDVRMRLVAGLSYLDGEKEIEEATRQFLEGMLWSAYAQSPTESLNAYTKLRVALASRRDTPSLKKIARAYMTGASAELQPLAAADCITWSLKDSDSAGAALAAKEIAAKFPKDVRIQLIACIAIGRDDWTAGRVYYETAKKLRAARADSKYGEEEFLMAEEIYEKSSGPPSRP